MTLGHISKDLSQTGSISSAPKTFSVHVSHKFNVVTLQTSCVPLSFTVHIHIEQQGVQLDVSLSLLQGMETLHDEGALLGTFLYDQDGDPAQTFKLPVSITPCN